MWQEIQQSFGTTQAAVVWVGVCVCACMHMCVLGLGAGRHRETSALDPRAGLECVCMCEPAEGWGRVGMGCESLTGRQAGSKKHLLCILGLASI